MSAPEKMHGISVTHELAPYEWSNEETAAYEAAVEAIHEAIAAYSALIATEEGKDWSDQSLIDEARAAQSRLVRERESLRSTDQEEIRQARLHYPGLAKDIVAKTG
ncbi:hypothetical protein [Streptomyces antibioticus]|uniref:hypothetical protein n=1 Tax=Streptomyces antibioticus TaxID=1890 RepID=UPI0033FC51C4